MHARELVELAVIVSCQARALTAGAARPDLPGLQAYWSASQCRLDRWSRGLNELAADPQAFHAERAPRAVALIEEILLSDVLTRTWTAALVAWQRTGARAASGDADVETLARGIWLRQMETRNRAVRWMLEQFPRSADVAASLDQLRRRAERWTDLLVGQVACVGDVSHFSADPERAREFADDLRHRHSGAGSAEGWALLLKSLAAAFRESLSETSPHADLNARVASSILATIGAEAYDTTGLFPSLWMTRLLGTALDAEVLIGELFAMDDEPLVGLVR